MVLFEGNIVHNHGNDLRPICHSDGIGYGDRPQPLIAIILLDVESVNILVAP